MPVLSMDSQKLSKRSKIDKKDSQLTILKWMYKIQHPINGLLLELPYHLSSQIHPKFISGSILYYLKETLTNPRCRFIEVLSSLVLTPRLSIIYFSVFQFYYCNILFLSYIILSLSKRNMMISPCGIHSHLTCHMLLLCFIQSLMTTEKKFLMIPLVGINDYFKILNLLVLCLDMGANNQSI